MMMKKKICKITKLYLRARWFYLHKMTFVAKMIFRRMRIFYSCEIPYTCQIDKTVYFAHNALGVVINSTAVIDENVTIYQNVTIGNRNSSKGPHIEKNVLIGANSVIIGEITIGANSKIGAGAIVVDDVPAQATFISNKAKQVIN